jgi:Na+-driven multidrug efflux pump
VTDRISQRSIALFWAPLAATWIMMGVEAPFLTAVIARHPEATFNLAAYGVAYAFAILTEAPVIMLMSAANALVQDGHSYKRMRNFSRFLNAAGTLFIFIIVVPPVFHLLMVDIIDLPTEVADLTYGALWLLLPWPSAIGYRRLHQGVLIRAGRTRLVAYGTVVRVSTMAGTAILAYLFLPVPGAWVGAMALSAGVVAESATVRVMASSTVRTLLAQTEDPSHTPDPLTYREIVSFYYPLALTSLIGLAVAPMLTFFMGRSAYPVESLAVFPVVQGLSFLFRSVGLAYQDAVIALMGERHRHLPELSRFTLTLGLSASATLALVAFTPLAHVWFQGVSGLTPHLAGFAVLPARVIAPLPALTVLLSLQRGILVNVRRTRPITMATSIEVVGIALCFVILGWGFGVVGATAAFVAFVVGRIAANIFLTFRCRQTIATTAASAVITA